MSEIITIKNKNYKATISTLGAEIHSLEGLSDGTQYIHDGDPSVWHNHAPILFPFVARCLDNTFIIEGKETTWTKNHGFARDLETKVIEQSESKVVFELTESEKTLDRYPYKFSLKTTYEVTEKGLDWKITVTNNDSKAFAFSTGTHAAFTAPRNTDEKGTAISDYEVVFEKQEPLTAVLCTPEGFLKADEEGTRPLTAPYGEKVNGVVPLTPQGFANGHLFLNTGSEWVGLKNKKTGKILKIGTKGFPYVMIWQNTSGDPRFVCIEPWYGIPDAENTDHIWENKAGLIELAPGASFDAIQNIVIE